MSACILESGIILVVHRTWLSNKMNGDEGKEHQVGNATENPIGRYLGKNTVIQNTALSFHVSSVKHVKSKTEK